MTKSPLINACLAAGYIIVVASLLYFAPHSLDAQPSVFLPIIMLSLLVLSVVVMALCFFYQPVHLFLEGQKSASTKLFVGTVMYFAAIVVLLFAAFIIFSKSLVG